MARGVHKLTARAVAAAKAPGLYADGGGLFLQVAIGRGGAVRRSWIVRYTAADGRRREMGLGSADLVELGDARDAALAQRKLAKAGTDPIDSRRKARKEAKAERTPQLTFKECAEAYIAAHEGSWRNDKHRAQWRSTLVTYAYPVMGGVPVADVSQDLVMRVLDPIWTTKTETASRLRGRIETILDWAAVRGHRTGDNPARWRGHLQKALPSRAKLAPVQHHRAVPIDQMPALYDALSHRTGAGADCLRFLILTAARYGEAAGATWGEIDFKNALWTVAAERMKGGRTHRVPLSKAALAVLKQRHDAAGNPEPSDLIFPSDMRKGAMISQATMAVLLRRMQRAETVHGFRSTFRDWAAEKTNFPREVAEAALAHVVGDKVEAAYRRGDLFQKRRALMDAWSAFCASKVRERSA
ncbi:MAG: tyrosine-type recombinase/integrase [Alphaproteobacteria bacterium]|nr:tyrosine-type recombinase/integrase [Alphaproteobacteria bacterium]